MLTVNSQSHRGASGVMTLIQAISRICQECVDEFEAVRIGDIEPHELNLEHLRSRFRTALAHVDEMARLNGQSTSADLKGYQQTV